MHLVMTLTDGRRAQHVAVASARAGTWEAVVRALPLGWPRDPEAYAVRVTGKASVRVDARAVLGQPPLLHGCTVSLVASVGTPARTLEHPARAEHTSRSPAEIRVVEGPDCGLSRALPAGGRVSIGRDPACTLTIADPALSRRHCAVRATRGGIEVTDLGSTNGAELDGTAVTGPLTWAPGQRLLVGGSVLELVVHTPLLLPAAPDGEGRLVVTPTPWAGPPTESVEVRTPPAPRPPSVSTPPVLGWALPLVVSMGLAVALQMPLLLLLGLMAPAMMLGGHVGERRQRQRAHREACAEHRRTLSAARAEVDRAVCAELRAAREAHPDLARWWAAVRDGPAHPLWSRAPLDGAVTVRLGRGEVPTAVCSDDSMQLGDDGPVTLTWRGALGVIGPPLLVRGLARGLLCQVLLAHDPGALRLGVCPSGPEWDWLAWAPHRTDRGQPATVQLEDRLGTTDRSMTDRGVTDRGVTDSAGRGLLLLLAGSRADLGQVEHLVEVLDTGTALVSRPPGTWDPFTPDLLGRSQAARMVRRLAPWRTAGSSRGSAGLPVRVALADLTAEAADPVALRGRWETTPRSTRCILGVGDAGPVAVDLSDDGPHALVAGTTGSGKSELLRTLVTGLALANRPDELVMVLVDYKGGSAFADCALLPHCVGLVTDLDPHLADRALTSLGAELKRRERALADAGARDLVDYREHDGVPPLPRLVIVIDEFRALAEELPTFVDGLIRIAALGRSLGVHLVLATQRPAGIVSADVRANLNLRIALRLRDAADSLDVLDTPDAARLPEGVPGRAILRTGGAPARAFQVASTAAGRSAPPTVSDHEPEPGAHVLVHPLSSPWTPAVEDSLTDQQPGSQSLLPAVVQATAQATAALGVLVPPSPWLEPLPEHLTVDDLGAHAPADLEPLCVAWGLLDLPAEQLRSTARWHPVRDGSLGIIGAPRSGATTMVRTSLSGLIDGHDAGAVHLYLFDSGAGLTSLAGAPHTGARVTPEEPQRVLRVLERLLDTLRQRRRALAAAGLTTYAEQRRGDDPWPLIVWVVDGWSRFAETLTEHARGAGLQTAHQLLAEGPSVGIVALVTGDRALLSGRVAATLTDVWALRLSDPTDLLLAGLSRRQIPSTMPPGRVIRTADGVVGQVAAVGRDPDGAAQVAAIGDLLARHRGRDAEVLSGRGPWRVVELPVRCDLDTLGPVEPGVTAPDVTIGVGGDDGIPVGLDLALGSAASSQTALVLGPPGSGRTTTLHTIGTSLRREGHRVVLVAPGDDPDVVLEDLSRGPAPCVLVDDADTLADSTVEEAVLGWAAGLPTRGGALVVAADTERAGAAYRGLVPLAGRSRCGVVLTPRHAVDGAALGVGVPVGGPVVPGRGILVHRGTCLPLQVAVAGTP
jgi:S-DNA-T family DNA segregation ATPase FtsK/SpoIIIE